jgi:ComF family protein
MKKAAIFLNTLIDLIYPKICVVCKKPLKNTGSQGKVICLECWSKIKMNVPPFCHCCGRHLEKKAFSKNICPQCLKAYYHFDRAFSPCIYEGVIKELIHEFKYKGKDHIGSLLSKLMIDFIKEYNFPINHIDAIIPIPLHKVRLREREFNQSEILGKNIASFFNKNLLPKALLRKRETKAQIDIEKDKRFANVRGCFLAADPQEIKDKNILLIDDVLTTASTSSEAAETLKEAGAKIVFVLTLAN